MILSAWFPPGLEIRKNLENGKAFSSQGILSRLEKSGKSQGILLKILEKLEKIYWKIEKNTGKVREICQPVIVKTLQIWYHTLNKKRTLKNTGKLRKIMESQGNLSVRKVGTMK